LGLLFPIEWKNKKNVPNHQPVIYMISVKYPTVTLETRRFDLSSDGHRRQQHADQLKALLHLGSGKTPWETHGKICKTQGKIRQPVDLAPL